MTSLICGIKKEMIQMSLQTRKRLTDLKQTEDCWRVGAGILREFGRVRYTLLCSKWNQQGPTVSHMELSVYGTSLDGRGVWRRMNPCIGMAEYLRCSCQTTTTLLYPQYKT